MSGAKKLKNQSRRNYFLAVYRRVVIIGFLLTFGAALAIVLIQMGTKGAIQISFAETEGKLESTASVPFNPLNLLNEKLRQKEAALTQKEIELRWVESRIVQAIMDNEARFLAYLLSASGTLFLLILLNFFFDYKRSLKLRSPR